MKIKVVTFDGLEKPKTEVIDNTLDGFYACMGCKHLEGYSGTELAHVYGLDLYLDGDGKLHDEKPPLVGVFVREETQEIVDTIIGKVLICPHDEEGESISVFDSAPLCVNTFVVARSETNIPDVWKDRFGEFKTSPYLLVLHC